MRDNHTSAPVDSFGLGTQPPNQGVLIGLFGQALTMRKAGPGPEALIIVVC